jgi:type III secretion system-like peptide-binding chaperone
VRFRRRRDDPASTPSPEPIPDPGPVPVGWEALERELTERASWTASDPTAAVVLVVDDTAHYVQWLGMPDEALYLEASSTFAAAQQERLTALGWLPPRPKGPANTPNWNQYRVAPVDAAEAARTTVHTLADVYGATPAGIQIDVVS